MTAPVVIAEVRKGSMWIRLNRPEAMNSLTPEVLLGIDKALNEAQDRADVISVVLTGTGRAFCAGLNLEAQNKGTDNLSVGSGATPTNIDLRNSIYGLEFVERREGLLTVTETIDRTAIDPYSFIRDAYLQRRKAQVRGTNGEGEKLPDYEDFEAQSTDKKALGIPTTK